MNSDLKGGGGGGKEGGDVSPTGAAAAGGGSSPPASSAAEAVGGGKPATPTATPTATPKRKLRPILVTDQMMEARSARRTGESPRRSYSGVVMGGKPGSTPPGNKYITSGQLKLHDFMPLIIEENNVKKTANKTANMNANTNASPIRSTGGASLSPLSQGAKKTAIKGVGALQPRGTGGQNLSRSLGPGPSFGSPGLKATSTPIGREVTLNYSEKGEKSKKDAILTDSALGTDREQRQDLMEKERKLREKWHKQSWQRVPNTFLMTDKNGKERRMFNNERNFFKQLDQHNRDMEERRNKRSQKQTAQERIPHRAAVQPTTPAATAKRTVEDRSDPNVTEQEQKRQKQDEEMLEKEAWWRRPENVKMTVRIVSQDFNVKLDAHDVSHINEYNNRSVLMACRDENGRLDRQAMAALRGTTGMSGSYIRVKMDTEDGIEWYREMVPKIPPRCEGGPGYYFLAPFERRFAEYQCFLESMDLTREGGMRDLEDILWAVGVQPRNLRALSSLL